MSYTARHPENLGAALVILGVVGLVFRKKIADWRMPPAQERMVAVANREFIESVTKWSAIVLIVAGVLLLVIEWLFVKR